MKKIFIVLLFVTSGVLLTMCSGEQKSEATTDEMIQETTETVVTDTAKATCPGCGMVMQKSQMVSYEVDGEIFYYCSEMCKEIHLSKKADKKKIEM